MPHLKTEEFWFCDYCDFKAKWAYEVVHHEHLTHGKKVSLSSKKFTEAKK